MYYEPLWFLAIKQIGVILVIWYFFIKPYLKKQRDKQEKN